MSFTSQQLAQASLISSVGGSVSSAVGSYYSTNAQQSSLSYQSDMAAINAGYSGINSKIAELGAETAMANGRQQIANYTMKVGQTMGTQRASQAANGIDMNSASASEVRASTEIAKDIDVGTLQQNAIRSAWGYRVAGLNADIQQNSQLASSSALSASASSLSGTSSAVSSLLNSAGSVASSWYKYSQAYGNTATGTGDVISGLYELNNGWSS